MAKRKMTKKQQRQVERAVKKAPVFFAIVFLLIVAIVVCYVLHKKKIIHIPFLDDSSSSSSMTEVDGQGGAFTQDDLALIKGGSVSIHFLELGNKYTGDCTLIKTGDTEILIDAGSRANSAETIISYVNTFCTDGKLEYVIATHADQDHIAAFPGVFEAFECGTIIDFPKTGKDTSVYHKYVAARTAEVTAGAVHYTALECWNNANGAQRSYTLGDGITMNFLYQKFYEEETNDENDYSVCMLLTETYVGGVNNYLFTGDLEEHGEASLVEKNDLPKCVLFKGGHHGSKTSSTDALLSVIEPDIVCVCCCAGSDEYKAKPENTFPTQAFVDRVAKYTKNVYVTTLANDTETGYESMNGNIVVYSQNGGISVRCSNNATILKDTDWFKQNRVCPDAWAANP
ncbi:MAG: MBL fold metallo-hydrolase [Clostridia bacterium]|nr:MBL fold metallo-hydrolase [Clostridia bacterium]